MISSYSFFIRLIPQQVTVPLFYFVNNSRASSLFHGYIFFFSFFLLAAPSPVSATLHREGRREASETSLNERRFYFREICKLAGLSVFSVNGSLHGDFVKSTRYPRFRSVNTSSSKAVSTQAATCISRINSRRYSRAKHRRPILVDAAN